ncbi:MAG: diaminopimelate decarboxylase, partial [Clostridia bacterium]|nr:diaminopimelate decarboxylase [Clostridia bacterium]
MFVSECLGVNEKGHLTIGGCDTLELAAEYSTPLYVMEESTIRESCRLYKNSIEKYYGGRGLVLYASKAFCCKEIYRIIDSEGVGADVVSAGEICTALSVGFPPEKL